MIIPHLNSGRNSNIVNERDKEEAIVFCSISHNLTFFFSQLIIIFCCLFYFELHKEKYYKNR